MAYRSHSILLVALYLVMLPISISAFAQQSSGTAAADQDLRSQVEQLRQLVQEQQKRISALEAERSGSRGVEAFKPLAPAVQQSSEQGGAQYPPGPSSVAPPASGENAQFNKNAGSSDERIRNLEHGMKALGPISFSGDMRLRGEPFLGGPYDESLDRMRVRFRARFNAIASLGSQFRTGITLASGDINDPTTTNQTLTGFYTRKPIALDQAFVEYRPKQLKFMTLVGGKFRYPWYNTELTWDKDLNPEGVAETFAFDLRTPVLKRLALVAFQLPFAEVAHTAPNDNGIQQQITYGGQLQTTWNLTPNIQLSAYSGFYWFDGSDSIAYALARSSSKSPQTPLVGALPLGTGNTVQNSIYTTTATNVVTVGGVSYPTGTTSVYNAQYASQFALFDNIARFDIDTGHPRWPVRLIGDYVQNTEACANLVNISAPPANTSTVTYSQKNNFNCVSNQRRGYWAEASVGRLQRKGDFLIEYARIFIEREAVLSNFNYSDIRQGSNVTEHRFDTFYQVDPSVQLGFTALIGRPLASKEPWLTRLQLDAIYIF